MRIGFLVAAAVPLTLVAGSCDTGLPVASAPEIVGTVAGPAATPIQPELRFYGTDLGWTFEHQGELQILFGDTWPHERSICDAPPTHDDSQGTLPLSLPDGGAPTVLVTPDVGQPDEFARIVLERDGESLPMGYGQVPVAAFSDGEKAIAIFGRIDYVRCEPPPLEAERACRPGRYEPARQLEHFLGRGLRCERSIGECVPAVPGVAAPCDVANQSGCTVAQTCQPSPTGFCVDPTSSRYDGAPGSLPFAVAHEIDFGAQDPAQRTRYRSLATLPTNKFFNNTARTVAAYDHTTGEHDYTNGTGALFVWGRPGYTAEQGRQAHLYLMTHALPFPDTQPRGWRFQPWYFAGSDPASGRPRWSRFESDAKPLAMDGIVDGSPHEPYPIVAQITVAWIGDPIRKWVMLYGGDLADYLLAAPFSARPGPAPGAIQIRFADDPWGPWSPPQPHFDPGLPQLAGPGYGPGGVLFHAACVDQPGLPCARKDPWRPLDLFLSPGCLPLVSRADPGRLYGANIIDSYTRPDGNGGVDMYWNVSTWNPYAVVLLKTNLRPPGR